MTTELIRNFSHQFISAIQRQPSKRSTEDVQLIFNVIRSFDCLARSDDHYLLQVARQATYLKKQANDILYCRGELANTSYILLSGSVFIDMNMFLPITSFGRRPSTNSNTTTARRPNECLILEPSDMLCIDASLDSCTNYRLSCYSTTSSISASASEESSSAGYSGSDTIDDLDLDGLQESAVDSDDCCEEEEKDDDYDYLEGCSIILRDAVRECLEKDPLERTPEDIQILLEFTQHLTAFNDLTTNVRRALCAVMVFAVVDQAGTIVLNHGEELDSWSVVVHGSVEIRRGDELITLLPGDSFGLPPTLDTQWFQGEMKTRVDDCQFICVTQEDYFRILKQGQDSQTTHLKNNAPVLITEQKQLENSVSTLIIRGTVEELMSQLVFAENPSSDPTYIEDFLLTYRIFTSGELLAEKLINWWMEEEEAKDRVTRVVLLWVNNHFVDFEESRGLMGFLGRFQTLLEQSAMTGQLRLLQIACSAKSRPREITLTRSNREEPLQFNIMGGSDSGYGIYVNSVEIGSKAEESGLRKGDEILAVNGKPCSSLGRSFEAVKNCTHVVLSVKCNFLGFYECVHSKIPLIPRTSANLQQQPPSTTTHVLTLKPQQSQKKKKKFRDIKTFFKLNLMGPLQHHQSHVNKAEEVEEEHAVGRIDFPENVLKIYRSDQSYKYFLVNKETTAREVVMLALQEWPDLQNQNSRDWTLFQVSVMNGILKQGRLPDGLDSLAERIPLGARYYIRHQQQTTALLPDELTPELTQDSRLHFLHLNPLELALQLTLEDYTTFRQIESIEFLNDLFDLQNSSTKNLQKFANLVNRETFWVVTEITREASITRRVAIIKRFIKIATQCKECRNYNSMFAIVSGLGHGAVARLKVTWDKIPRKYVRWFQEMQHLMDPTRNMGKYRTLLSSSTTTSTTPLIPFYPIIRKDLTFIHLGNSTQINNLINFEKMRMLAKEIRSIIQMSNLPFDTSATPCLASMNQLQAVTTTKGKKKAGRVVEANARKMFEEMNMIRKIKTYLGGLSVLEDEELLYQLSTQCEPGVTNTIRKQKPPGSPTLSTCSSATASSSQEAGARLAGLGVAGESYQKLMSLSERSVVVCSSGNGSGGSQKNKPGGGVEVQSSSRHERSSSDASSSTSSYHRQALLSLESSSVLPAINRATATTKQEP